MSNNVPVRFLKAWRTYFTNDVAGFDKERADELVDGGVAEYASETSSATLAARKASRKPQTRAPASTPAADTQEPTPPAGATSEGSDSDNDEKP